MSVVCFVSARFGVRSVQRKRPAVCSGRRVRVGMVLRDPDDENEDAATVHRNDDISAAASYLNEEAVEKDGGLWEYRPFTTVPYPDWKEHMRTLIGSEVFVRIREQLLFTVILATFAAFLNFFAKGLITLTTVPHMLCGVAMGLLLVFRTEKAYDRFWEGRTWWSQLISVSRALTQLTTTYVRSELATRNVLRLVEVFPYALKDHLRCETVIEPTASLLTREEWTIYWSSKRNRPATIVALLGSAIAAADDGTNNYGERADPLLRGLFDILSGCEKIVKTPVPMSYVRHTSRFLTVWLTTLPFALVTTFSFLSIPITAVLCWGLLSVKTLAEIIERPFENQDAGQDMAPRSQLPVEDFCKEVEWDIYELRRVRRKLSELKAGVRKSEAK